MWVTAALVHADGRQHSFRADGDPKLKAVRAFHAVGLALLTRVPPIQATQEDDPLRTGLPVRSDPQDDMLSRALRIGGSRSGGGAWHLLNLALANADFETNPGRCAAWARRCLPARGTSGWGGAG